MRILSTLISLAVGGYGLYWMAEKNPDLKTKAEEMLDFRTTSALETRFGFEQIQEAHQRRLLKEKGTRYSLPELKFYPYLLLEVKYSEKGRTKEGIVLWDLTDGEMVLDTRTWEKTHGFADCILNSAGSHEIQVLHALSEKGGTADLSALRSKLDLELPVLEMVIRSCLKKNLILSNGANRYRLHLANPNLTTSPDTKLHEPLTTRAHKRATRAKRHFSKGQVERIAKLAFGEEFSIRTTTEIFLPIHRIVVEHPDGALRTFHFNALTGQELPAAPFYQ